jgi:hypothetical protein
MLGVNKLLLVLLGRIREERTWQSPTGNSNMKPAKCNIE